MNRTAEDTWVGAADHTAIYDPVPAQSCSEIYGGSCSSPHSVEIDVQRALLGLEDVEFSSLRVHRLRDGVCLTGVVRGPKNVEKVVSQRAAQVAGVERVLNHLVVQPFDFIKL